MEKFETAIAELNKEQHIPRSIEFTVQEDFMKNLPTIVSNLEQVEAWAVEQTKEDRTALLETEEDFEKARERCAQLKKMIDLIDRKRIDTKKEYNRPYEIFEKACKRVTAVLQEARDNKWSQITKAEEAEKEKKKQQLSDIWWEIVRGNLATDISFEKVFNPKWLNKSVRVETAEEEMKKISESIENDIRGIFSLSSEFQVSLLEYYKDGHNVSEVIAYNNRLQAQKQAQIQREEQGRGNAQPKQETENLPQKNEPNEETEELIRMEFFVECTNEQLQGLGNYLREHGIKYGRIKN